MEQESIFVGIDVAKAQLDVAVRPAGDRWEISHDDAGIGQLVSQLKSLEPAMVLVEASGGLELPLVAALATGELPVVVVNPPHDLIDMVTEGGNEPQNCGYRRPGGNREPRECSRVHRASAG